MLSVPTWSCQKVTKQRLSLGYTDGELAGIESITTSFGNKGVKVYSLQGNQIATASSMSELHLSNGIYIINNKKVVIK